MNRTGIYKITLTIILLCLFTAPALSDEVKTGAGSDIFLYLSPFNLGPSINMLQFGQEEEGLNPYLYLMHVELMKAAVVHSKLKLGIGVTYTNYFLLLDEYVSTAGALYPVYLYYFLSYKTKDVPVYNSIFPNRSAELFRKKVIPLYLYYGLCYWFDGIGDRGMHDAGICWNLSTFLSMKFGYMYCDYFYEHSLYFTTSVEFGNWSVIKKNK